ncbi:MAG: hypothetical protein E6J34_18095 [Chloroflexi bacterium]|nr:MAG: hypothetical protein E6J34_18095 [Chloroflexota bacterium]
MSQHQPEVKQSAVERATQWWESVGDSVKSFAIHSGQQAMLAVSTLQTRSSQTERPPTEQQQASYSQEQAREPEAPPMQRAEYLIDRAGQRLNVGVSVVGVQIRRSTALMREGVEDMWAEAQSIRQRNLRR